MSMVLWWGWVGPEDLAGLPNLNSMVPQGNGLDLGTLEDFLNCNSMVLQPERVRFGDLLPLTSLRDRSRIFRPAAFCASSERSSRR